MKTQFVYIWKTPRGARRFSIAKTKSLRDILESESNLIEDHADIYTANYPENTIVLGNEIHMIEWDID